LIKLDEANEDFPKSKGLTCDDHFAGDEDEEDDLGLVQPIDEAGKELGLVAAELRVAGVEALEAQAEADVDAAHDVLDLEVHELGAEAELLDDARVLAGGEARVVLGLGARAHHLARAEDEGGGARRADAHDHGREPLRVVLGVARVQRDLLQLQLAAQVHRAHDVSGRRKRDKEIFSWCGHVASAFYYKSF